MSISRFKVSWRFDGTEGGTVTIDRASNIIAVRPLRRHRTYALPLAFVAQLVCERIIKAEAQEKRAAAKARRRGLAR